MTEYSDEDLLVLMSFQKENKKEAEEAFVVFYDRHKQFLWNLCCKVCRDKDLAKDVMQNTWIAIYKYGSTYNAKKSNINTWMSRIANNEMKDLLKIEANYTHLNEEIYSISTDEDEEDFDYISPEKRILDEALNELSERDKDVLFTYMRYADGKKHLPDEVIREICQRYGTTPENLRQIRKRSWDKVKNHTLNKANTINKSK
jgi:RNA polymerase sigma factor (sigma-70 family)